MMPRKPKSLRCPECGALTLTPTCIACETRAAVRVDLPKVKHDEELTWELPTLAELRREAMEETSPGCPAPVPELSERFRPLRPDEIFPWLRPEQGRGTLPLFARQAEGIIAHAVNALPQPSAFLAEGKGGAA